MAWFGSSEWCRKDYLLTLAYTKYLDGMCSCGFPKNVCRHPENDGWFETEIVQCHAQAAVESEQASEGFTPAPGERLVAKYTRPESKPLPPLGEPDDQQRSR